MVGLSLAPAIAQSAQRNPLLSFGAHLTMGSFVFSLARGMDNVLIGRFYGPAWVGLYSRASALLMRPLEQFLTPINAVFVPALSRLQSQPERYRATFLRLYEAVALIGFLFTSLFLALAHPLTLVLLGPRWERATIIFGGFTIAALCVPLASASTWLFTNQGRGRDMLVAQSINSCAIILSFIVGLPFGPIGVAIAFFHFRSLNSAVHLVFYRWTTWSLTDGRFVDRFFRHLPLWIVVFVVTWLTLILVANLPPLVQPLICAPVGGVVGAVFICSFSRQRQVVIYLFEALRELERARADIVKPANG